MSLLLQSAACVCACRTMCLPDCNTASSAGCYLGAHIVHPGNKRRLHRAFSSSTFRLY